MTQVFQPNSRNILVNSPHYGEILKQYNENFAMANGKMNDRKFYNEILLPKVPGYSIGSWYQFLRRWKDSTGITAKAGILMPTSTAIEQQEILKKNMRSNDEATQIGIRSALNLGAAFYENLWKKYSEGIPLTPFEEKVLSDSLFKGMKSQDSRIHALGKIREDDREQAKFDRAFQGGSMDD